MSLKTKPKEVRVNIASPTSMTDPEKPECIRNTALDIVPATREDIGRIDANMAGSSTYTALVDLIAAWRTSMREL
jgi:hypothetical protein